MYVEYFITMLGVIIHEVVFFPISLTIKKEYYVDTYVYQLLTNGNCIFLLSITGLMGYLQFEFIGANHIEFALISSIFYMFTESLVMFYF